MYYILDRKFKKLNSLKFESIELVFDNKAKNYFTKNDLNFYVEGRGRNQENQFFQTPKDKITKDNAEMFKKIILNKNSNEFAKRIAINEQLMQIN